MRLVIRRALPLAVVLALAPAASAGAAVFTPADGDALEAAFNQAQANGEDDTITLTPAATYTRGTGAAFSYSTGEAHKLTLIGQGATVTAPGGSGFVALTLDGGTLDVSHVRVLVEGNAAGGFSIGGSATVATVDDVRVSGTTSDPSAYGVRLSGTTSATNVASSATVGTGMRLEGPDVTVEGADVTGATTRQVGVSDGLATITDAVLSGPDGVSATGLDVDGSGAIVTARRLTITGTYTGASATFGADLTITDSLLRISDQYASALRAGDFGNNSPFASTVTADRVTIVGTGANGQTAANVGGGSASEQDMMRIDVRGSIITGVPTTFSCSEGNTQSVNTINVFTTSVPADATENDQCADPPDAGITHGKGFTTLAPLFADAAAGDYRQRYDSPLIDRGTPTDPLVGSDLGGGLRYINGAVDLGAYEYQRAAPEVTAGSTPASPTAGLPATLTATATDADPGETAQLTYAWSFSDGTTATGASPLHVFSIIGSASATVTVTDPTGLETTKTVQLDVVAPPREPVNGPAGPASTSATSDRTAPVLGALRVTKTIRLGKKLPGAVTRGGQVRFTLSEAATVSVRFERVAGKRGVRVPGTLKARLKAGKRALRFTGRITKKLTLKPGAYRIVLTATDAAGNVGSAVRAPFTLR